MPAPPTRAEALRRVNDALPQGVAIVWRPAGLGGALACYRVLVDRRPVDACASLEGAIFKAKARGRGRPGRPAQPQLDFAGSAYSGAAHHG